MLKGQPGDTDLINELVRNFGQNQATLATLVKKVEHESKTNLDPIAQSKLKQLRLDMLIEDVKGQDQKIETITSVLDEVCSPTILPKG